MWHSENHWSNETTMLRFAENILIPYVRETGDRLDLALKQPALAIFDVFAAHRVQSFIDKLTKAGIRIRYVPGGCTGELQPLDLSGNAQLKENVKNQFTNWYANQVSEQLCKKDIKDINIDLRLSLIKPQHAKWLINAFDSVKDNSELFQLGWKKAGLLK